jgi:site-specific recombinase XerD
MYEKIKEYLSWKETHAERASVTYKKPLMQFVEISGELQLEEYVIKDVVAYSKWMKAFYAPATIRYALIVLKDFFGFYKEQGYECLSPKLIKLPKKKPANSHRAVKEAEVKQMIAVVEGDSFISLRNKLILIMLWNTGVRVTELCRLNIADIDIAREETLIGTEKRDILRIIMWEPSTHALLVKYIDAHKKHFGNKLVTPLFLDTRARKIITPITSRTIERIVKYYADKAGITRKTSPHSFRHGWAQLRRDRGLPLSFVQKGLGHAHPVSTMIYQQYSDPEFVSVGRAFFGSPYHHSPKYETTVPMSTSVA